MGFFSLIFQKMHDDRSDAMSSLQELPAHQAVRIRNLCDEFIRIHPGEGFSRTPGDELLNRLGISGEDIFLAYELKNHNGYAVTGKGIFRIGEKPTSYTKLASKTIYRNDTYGLISLYSNALIGSIAFRGKTKYKTFYELTQLFVDIQAVVRETNSKIEGDVQRTDGNVEISENTWQDIVEEYDRKH